MSGLVKNRVLIVDDDNVVLELYKQVLEKDGYDVHVASSAEEVLKIDLNQHFHLYLLDLRLPQMNGIELCKILKKNNPVSVVYAVTGYPSIFELVNCRDSGFEDYFSKPVSLDILRESVHNALSKINRWSGDQ